MPQGSYTTSFLKKEHAKFHKKLAREAVETIIGAMANDDENFIYEAGDLLYHLVVLLTHKGFRIEDIVSELRKRHSLDFYPFLTLSKKWFFKTWLSNIVS
jgi:phosphoribosyl-AMP cyclohydrolase / phosphoribosyl-ATP pyrophosphohydrolase